jgi:DNA-binding MarR family transcriptional regulator
MSEKSDFDLQDFLPYLLNRAAEVSSLDFQGYYKAQYGMLRTEWRVLFHLGRYGTLTATDLCHRAGLHKTKVSRAVAALEKKRFLTRTELQDRRHDALNLTRAGLAAYGDLSQAAARFDATLAQEFSATELDMLRRCLKVIAGA